MEGADSTEARARLRAGRSIFDGAGANYPTSAKALSAGSSSPPAPGAPRRTGRGYVTSYGEARVCAATGCMTRLSRYNERDICALHSARRDRGREAPSMDGNDRAHGPVEC